MDTRYIRTDTIIDPHENPSFVVSIKILLIHYDMVLMKIFQFKVKSQGCGEPSMVHVDGTDRVVGAGERSAIIVSKTGKQDQQWKVCPNEDGKTISFLSVSNG